MNYWDFWDCYWKEWRAMNKCCRIFQCLFVKEKVYLNMRRSIDLIWISTYLSSWCPFYLISAWVDLSDFDSFISLIAIPTKRVVPTATAAEFVSLTILQVISASFLNQEYSDRLLSTMSSRFESFLSTTRELLAAIARCSTVQFARESIPRSYLTPFAVRPSSSIGFHSNDVFHFSSSRRFPRWLSIAFSLLRDHISVMAVIPMMMLFLLLMMLLTYPFTSYSRIQFKLILYQSRRQSNNLFVV